MYATLIIVYKGKFNGSLGQIQQTNKNCVVTKRPIMHSKKEWPWPWTMATTRANNMNKLCKIKIQAKCGYFACHYKQSDPPTCTLIMP